MSMVGSLRAALRPPLAAVLSPLARPLRPIIEHTRDGRRLSPGISAVVAARDEEYTIGFCLEGLLGLADQIVCIDNGSEDATLDQIEAFAEKHGNRVDMDVVSLPGAQLVDCWEEGLRRTTRQWHLRWDADRVAHTTGPDSVVELRERVLRDARPRTIQLPYVNLHGDLRHTLRLLPVLGGGEPYLIRFGRGIRYREYGRLPAVKVPLYYEQLQEPRQHFFHLGGLKSDRNLMHRFYYFDWRGVVNRDGDAIDPELRTLDGFKRRRNVELFGTDEPRSVKFRYQRQLCRQLVRYDPEQYGEYPEALQAELSSPEPRFEVVYRDGRPWARIDRADKEMLEYKPTPADLTWNPEDFLRRILTDEQCRTIGISPEP